MNEFVNYLNSTNNVGGNSTGSLAESQVKSSYYDSVKVDRKLGEYIAQCVRSGKHAAFILTGHAGDGKTSILVQVLKSLNYLNNNDGISMEKEFDDFFYVKDMSEIAADRQEQTLKRALQAPENNKTSLLISNTGPLLKAFELLAKENAKLNNTDFTEKERIELQSTLLTQLDTNSEAPVTVAGFSFTLVNIARVDNVPFAAKILKNILNEHLWQPCQNCACKERCPIKNNRDTVADNLNRVIRFIESYYRYLYENGKRMTIRQMIGQISYALTGNLTCNQIKSSHIREPFFNYNFANLFFGFVGLKPAKDATQIKGIEQIRELQLDRISLDVDYTLFVNQNYESFALNLQRILQELNKKYRMHYQISDGDGKQAEKQHERELQMRRAVRRFYLMYSLAENNAEIDTIMNTIFGAFFTQYCALILSTQSKTVLNSMRNTIFDALYIKNTGFLPSGKTELPLTLRREDDVFQNVMIVLGEVNRFDLNVIQPAIDNNFEDVEDKHELYLQMKDIKFHLTYPMINYFNDLINGAINSNNNPALSHGISQLDTLLFDRFSEQKPECEEDCELTVMINTTKGQEIERFSFDGNRLEIS